MAAMIAHVLSPVKGIARVISLSGHLSSQTDGSGRIYQKEGIADIIE